LLDVAHNPQAARVLAQRCALLPPVTETTVVLGLLADKSVDGVVAALAPLEPERWITCTTASHRGREAQALAERLRALGLREVSAGGAVAEALADAARASAADGRIIVCGSFMVVGPALDWLAVP
jgi:dihydrofolate synthase/folylpolyglutamate synthase